MLLCYRFCHEHKNRAKTTTREFCREYQNIAYFVSICLVQNLKFCIFKELHKLQTVANFMPQISKCCKCAVLFILLFYVFLLLSFFDHIFFIFEILVFSNLLTTCPSQNRKVQVFFVFLKLHICLSSSYKRTRLCGVHSICLISLQNNTDKPRSVNPKFCLGFLIFWREFYWKHLLSRHPIFYVFFWV